MFDPSFLQPPLAAEATAAWRRFRERLDTDHAARLDAWLEAQPDDRQELARTFALSEFAATVAMAHPDSFVAFLESTAYRQAPPSDCVGTRLAAVDDVEELKSLLRRLRNGAMLHIIWRDLNGRSDLAETTRSLTGLADRLIDAAVAKLHEWAVAADGDPIGRESAKPQQLVVIALGKLGAGELNLSSDVDLIFAYAEQGETRGGARTNQQFFLRLGQKLINVLDAITVDGFVFRVDMRLRPYGDSGALVLHFDAIERYYEEQGRDWERYAWIRARACAGDLASGRRLIEDLRPFVFRRYLDFGAIQSLREMKSRIDSERSRSAMRDDVKLGPGGIREVEFVAQMHQLIWAGRQSALQCSGVVETLHALASHKLMARAQADQLADAYRFLRNVEHRLQAIRDEQTQLLPATPIDQMRVATGMGFADFVQFGNALAEQRAVVARAFESVIQADARDHRRPLATGVGRR